MYTFYFFYILFFFYCLLFTLHFFLLFTFYFYVISFYFLLYTYYFLLLLSKLMPKYIYQMLIVFKSWIVFGKKLVLFQKPIPLWELHKRGTAHNPHFLTSFLALWSIKKNSGRGVEPPELEKALTFREANLLDYRRVALQTFRITIGH